MDAISDLEDRSIFILREAFANYKNLGMLWSIGKDSTVLLWLARKAFFGHVPFPLVHIDTGFKIPEMIKYRDELILRERLQLIVGTNIAALREKNTFPDGRLTRVQCCGVLKTKTLSDTLSGKGERWRLNLASKKLEVDAHSEPITGVIAGIRADEEGSRSKERYFSPRDQYDEWHIDFQPPEIWNQYKTDFAPGTHVRIHPLLDWTELDIWRYIVAENIPVIPIYFNQGNGQRFRSLGCWPCTKPVASTARNAAEIVAELEDGKFKNIAERSGRDQDKEDGGGLEKLRREGYM